MLYFILIYLIAFACFAYKILDKDLLAPTVITGFTLILGTFVACIGNVNWKVKVPWEILLIYVLGTSSLLFGELVLKQKCYKSTFRLDTTQKYKIKEVNIPKWITFTAVLFSIVIVLLSQKKSIQIAYENGYYGAEWQSMPVYVKHAISSGRAHYGALLSIGRQLLENFTYLGLFLFISNGSISGFKNAFKTHSYLLIFIVLYAYMLSFQGQRSNFIALIAFCFYTFWIQNAHLKVELNYKKIILAGSIFIVLFLVYFTIAGSLTGRSANSSALENIYIYIGSSIVDFAELFNSDAKKYTLTWGALTFNGIYTTLRRLIPALPIINKALNSFDFGFITFANGSKSNVYGPYAVIFTEFSYFGVALLTFIQGCIYRLLYNTVRKYNATPWGIYLFSFISYGIVIAFIDEQQFSLLFSVYQLMHLTIAYILLNFCLKKYSKI